MNGHGLHGTVDDAEAAALLCELRASPVVHTSALYPRPSLPHVHTHDLRLPSPHEILAHADWHRFSSSSERLTSEPQLPLPRPAFSPAPTSTFLYPESTPTTLPPPRFPPLALDSDRPKRKRETEPDHPPVRRPRRATDESDESEYFFGAHGSSGSSAQRLPSPPPPRQASPPRRGYLSMSALGVLEAPPPPPRPPSPRAWETPTREHAPQALPPVARDYPAREYHTPGEHVRGYPQAAREHVAREFASPIPREYPTASAPRDYPPSSSRQYPPSSSRDYPPPSRDYPPSSNREFPPSGRDYPPSSSRDYPPSSSREYPPAPPSSAPSSSARRLRITAPAPDNIYMFPQPAMSPYGSTPLEAERDRARAGVESGERERIRVTMESGERVSTPTSTLVPMPHMKGSRPGPPLHPPQRPTQQLPPQVQTSPTHPSIQTHRLPTQPQPPTPGSFRAPSFSAVQGVGSRVRGTSNADPSMFASRPRPEPIEIEDSPEPEAPLAPTPIRTAREDIPRPIMGTRFTDSTIPPFRAPKIETSRGALGLDVSPQSAKRETFTSAFMRYEVAAPSAPIPVHGGRIAPSSIGGPLPSPIGRTAPSPTGRIVTSPVGRIATSPVGRTATSPVGRMDRPRAVPEPYTDTETDKDADAPSSPLSEDETADEDDERRGVGRGKARAEMDVDIEVRPGRSIAPILVSETSSHPFPFRTGSRPPPTPTSYSTRADARVLHGDMEIYPVNSPPAPKTVFGPAPLSGGSSGKRGRGMTTSPVVRTRKLPSPVVQTKALTSPVSIPRPLPSPVVSKKASVSPVQLTIRLPAVSVDLGSRAPLPPPTPTEPDIPVPKIRCVCRSTQDDRGRTIVCEGCGFRQHARCYGLDGEGEVGGRWMCGMCEGGPGGWRKVEERVEAKEAMVVESGPEDVKDVVGTGHGLGEGDVGKEVEVGKDRAEVGNELASVERERTEVGKEPVEGEEEVADRGLENAGKVEPEDVGLARADVEMEEVGPGNERAREMDMEKDKEVVAEPQPVTVKKKEPTGKSKAPGAGSKPGLGGFKTNAKNAKSGTASLSKIIPPPTKSLTPTVRTVLAPPKSTKASSSKSGPPKSAPSKPLSSSSSKPPSFTGKVKSIKTGSRASSMNGSPLVRTRPLSPEPTPSAPPSPRSGSPSIAPGPDAIVKEVERTKSVEPVLKVIEKAPTPPPSNPSPIATRTALPLSSPPRPPTPPAPSPPKPSAPSADAGDDDIDAALWATEYDHINSNIVDASLRERLRNFGRERLAKRAEVVGEKPSIPPLTPFTSAEPGFLTSSQPTSLVRVKEIKPPPNQHAPTYGVLATSPISKGALVLEYRCALSDAHAYMSNKAHQYALLGTGTKYVRLVPAPLDICLDARVMGNEGRFVRCGCWPNAVVRPFICVEGAVGDEDEEETRFGVFALRELELGEEIVLGWEWSVEHVIHKVVRDPKLGPLPEDEDVLNDPDTKRLWDILDLLRSLSMTCACKPDSTNCALSFGRMLVEDTDSVGHASDLGPLVGHIRYDNGFEPSMHAVSTKTRRGRKSAGRKARQVPARPISPIPKVPSPPPVISIPKPEPEPKPESEPESIPISFPPRDPTPPPRDPTPPPPPPPPITTPAKRAIGKLSIASSPLSELSDAGDEHRDEISPDHAPKRHRGSTSTRSKHKRRIESPMPEEDTETRSRPAGNVLTENVEVEADGVGASKEAHEAAPAPNQGDEDNGQAVVLQEVTIKVELEELGSGPGVNESYTDAAAAAAEAAHAGIEFGTPDPFPLHVDTGHDHDHDSDHLEAPKKVSFLDWARRRRATQAAETKDLVPVSTDEAGTPAPDMPPASTEVDSIPSNPPSLSPTTSNLPVPNTNSAEPLPSPPRTSPVAKTIAPMPVVRPTPPTPATLITPPSDATIHEPPTPAPPDVIMADPPTINGKPPIALYETSNSGAGASRFSPSMYTPPGQSSPASSVKPPLPDAMDVDPVDPVATVADRGQNRASLSPFADGPSYQPSTSHTPLNPSSPPPEQTNSSPGVLPALTKRLSHLGVEQLKTNQDMINLRSSPADASPPPPRAPRSFGDVPEEGEITPASRAPPASDTPSNGSPAPTTASLPSGPRDRQPPTQPRRFSADPPPSVSPSGSTSARPSTLPYPRLPPSGPSRGVSSSPRAPPSGPRAERRGYLGPSPPTGPRERERERERERDRDRDRDRDARGRGRGFSGTVPRGPSAERNWRGRGRGLPSRGAWRQ
ncbi:hypothetical protein FRC10_004060 [Ceratobasidium sp. 414]|nr:hypothetical protein FRC10_004060 [Ceratobasidium sp. 414]